jgi:hypothetical protein
MDCCGDHTCYTRIAWDHVDRQAEIKVGVLFAWQSMLGV